MSEPKPAEIIIYQPGLAPARITLSVETISIGRGGDCAIPIKDRFLSRMHAEVIWSDDDTWILKDLGSANGTFVNGEKIDGSWDLKTGDRIELGDAELVFFAEPMQGDAITIVPDSAPPEQELTLRDEDDLTVPRATIPKAPPTVANARPATPTVATGKHATPTIFAQTAKPKIATSPDVTISTSSDTTISLRMDDIITEERVLEPNTARLKLVSRLAMELIEERPLIELFDFIVERIHKILDPAHVAIALLAPDRESFELIRVMPREEEDEDPFTISTTLLSEIVEEKRVIAFTDISDDSTLARADSIVDQKITSVLCAPLVVGDSVLGVLYLDYRLEQRTITEDDARLAANVARLVASKLETSRLREEALEKQKIDEELKTAYLVQSRLLPTHPPEVPGYRLGGKNLPVRTVSGDYYDFVLRKDGKLYFVVADVSGKGITAALVMAGLAMAFEIFTRGELSPSELLAELNRTLVPNTSPSKFVTLFVGLLDPETGSIIYANAGHTPPLWIRKGGVDRPQKSDMVIGLFADAEYHDQTLRLDPGDALALFTDGIIEAENHEEEELGSAPVKDSLKGLHGASPEKVIERLEEVVENHVQGRPLADDVTMIVVSRDK